MVKVSYSSIQSAVDPVSKEYDVFKNKSIESKMQPYHLTRLNPPTHLANIYHTYRSCSSATKPIEPWNEKSPHKRGVRSRRNSAAYSRRAVQRLVRMWNWRFMRLYDKFDDNGRERRIRFWGNQN